MARYARIYKNPKNPQSNIIGFSGGLFPAAQDPELFSWLERRGYTVTPESPEQRNANFILGDMMVRTEAYHDAPGIPLPERTVSAAHLMIEPPLKNDDLLPLGAFLSHLASIDDGGLRRHLLVDNRDRPPEPYQSGPSNVIYRW